MKKKLMIALIVVAVIAGAIFAWRVAYSMQKNTDNIPTLAMVSEMDDASFLVGYRSNQLITVWNILAHQTKIDRNKSHKKA